MSLTFEFARKALIALVIICATAGMLWMAANTVSGI